MNSLKRRFVERDLVRRKTDHSLIRQNERLNRLYKMGQVITSEMNLNEQDLKIFFSIADYVAISLENSNRKDQFQFIG